MEEYKLDLTAAEDYPGARAKYNLPDRYVHPFNAPNETGTYLDIHESAGIIIGDQVKLAIGSNIYEIKAFALMDEDVKGLNTNLAGKIAAILDTGGCVQVDRLIRV